MTLPGGQSGPLSLLRAEDLTIGRGRAGNAASGLRLIGAWQDNPAAVQAEDRGGRLLRSRNQLLFTAGRALEKLMVLKPLVVDRAQTGAFASLTGEDAGGAAKAGLDCETGPSEPRRIARDP